MALITINRPHLCTKIDIWYPKYHTDSDEYEVWLSKKKVAYASPVIIVNITKAKHLIGQRFCVKRDVVERCEQGTNGKIPVYRVSMSKFHSWQSGQEVRELAEGLFED